MFATIVKPVLIFVLVSNVFTVNAFTHILQTKFSIFNILFGEKDMQKEKCSKCYCGQAFWNRSPRLNGGSYVAPFEFPWIAFIYIKDENVDQFKLGTIINDMYVITSATNVYMFNQLQIQVHIGKYQKCAPQTTHVISGVSNIFIHPGFIPKLDIHNTALLKLSTKIEFNENHLPICLPSPNADYVGEVGIVAGFPYEPMEVVPLDSDIDSYCLPQKASFPILPSTECLDDTDKPNQHSFELCLGIPGSKNIICEADSGASVMHKNSKGYHEIVGIISNKQACEQENSQNPITTRNMVLGIATALSQHSNWIMDNTKDACYCDKP